MSGLGESMKNHSANVLKALVILFVSTNSPIYRYLKDILKGIVCLKIEASPFSTNRHVNKALVTDYKPHDTSRVPQRGKNST